MNQTGRKLTACAYDRRDADRNQGGAGPKEFASRDAPPAIVPAAHSTCRDKFCHVEVDRFLAAPNEAVGEA